MAGEIILETTKVSKLFGEYRAVDSVDFSVEKGDCVGIIGPNGAGKSTFFNLLTGMYVPNEGKIYYQNEDITNRRADQRVALGMVRTFQLVSVFDSLSVLQNLILSVVRFSDSYTNNRAFFFSKAECPEVAEKCMFALQRVGLQDRASDLASVLSYGEKRKLEISMALSLNPKILLLDEPLAGLSDYEIKEILSLIRAVKKEFTIILIEHKISQVKDLVTRLSVMHEGRMIGQGKPEDIIHDKEIRRIYWGAAK